MIRIHRFGWLFLAVTSPFAFAADPAAPAAIQQTTPAQAAPAQKAATAPARMIGLFVKRSTCPNGWEPATNTYGRMLVATTTGGNVGVTVGTAGRTLNPLLHSHTASISVSLASKSVAAANGGSNSVGAANGTRKGSARAIDGATNLPFYAYLACRVPLGGLQ